MKDYQIELPELYKKFNSSPKGLNNNRAKIALGHYGRNELVKTKQISALTIFLNQFKSFIIYILLAAFFISLALGYIHQDPQDKFDSYVDAGVIFAILIVNAILGFLQEYKAEKSIEALKKLTGLKAKVIRNGITHEIDAALLVPGDIIVLETGEKVPADARMIEIYALETQEAVLTGESTPVSKTLSTIKSEVDVVDRKNMIFSGTIITRGRGKALVCSTGMKTQIGKIAKLIQEQEPEMTPLQMKLQQLGTRIGILVLAVAAIVFLTGWLKGAGVEEIAMSAIALAVAAVPEGLPAVVTISLALGVQRMIKKNALIRKLHSVETLGSTTVICSDKTGTLTKNEMTVRKIFANNELIEVSGAGYDQYGKFSKDPKQFELLLKCGALCNDAILNDTLIGDPTEGALIVSAAKAGLVKKKLEDDNPRLDENPFDSERKMMSTTHRADKIRTMYTKGAPERVLNCCKSILINGRIEVLDAKIKETILQENEKLANEALRVLGFAYKELDCDTKEEDLIFLGLQAMIDPPREEVKLAIKKCRSAGIKVVMITGDHKDTAVAIANELGIHGKAITGAELDKITNLESVVDDIAVYARVNPEHKFKIVTALQARGHVVAMTGDGVNDAPALKKAEIGIAMGITGTDVAKEASGMILVDDNFASIVNAVEEGRGTYDNIRKYFAFLISGNTAEVLIVFLGLIFGLPLPLTAKQILLINLVTDGLPAVALSADPFEPNAMSRKPRRQDEPIYTKMNAFILYYPIVLTITALSVFSVYYFGENSLLRAQTAAFIIIGMFELYQAFTCRSIIYPLLKIGVFKNKYLILAAASSFALIASLVLIPSFGGMMEMAQFSAFEFIALAALASIGGIIIETSKYLNLNKKLKEQSK